MKKNNQQKSVKSRVISVITKTILVLLVLLLGFGFLAYWYLVKCEGDWQGVPLEEQGIFDLSAIKTELQSDVAFIAGLGPRNAEDPISYEQLRTCEVWIIEKWVSQGYTPRLQNVSVSGQQFYNIEIEFSGTVSPSEIVIISAQYDTEPESPRWVCYRFCRWACRSCTEAEAGECHLGSQICSCGRGDLGGGIRGIKGINQAPLS